MLEVIIGDEGQSWQGLQLLKMDRATRDIPVIFCAVAVRQVKELQAHLDETGVAVALKRFDIDHLHADVASTWDAPSDPLRPPTSAASSGLRS